MFRLPNCEAEGLSYEKEDAELAFVQFYEAAPPIDNIDKALGCIRLVWATGPERILQQDHTNETNTQSPTPWYSLIPVSTIRGVAHVICGDCGVDGASVVRDIDSVRLHEQPFYVNRFISTLRVTGMRKSKYNKN